MVPTTATSVLLFLAALGPGYVYVRRVESLEARHKSSVFRETVSIIITSLGFLASALITFAVVRIFVPTHTPDIGALVRAPQEYSLANYQYLTTWACGIFILALVLAITFSHPRVRDSRIWRSKAVVAVRGRPVMDARSSWSRLFKTDEGTIVRVSCELDDGSWIDGWLYDWNAQPEEDGDRTITLHGPLRVRPKGHDCVSPLVGVTFSVVASGKIVRLDVTHVAEELRFEFDAVYMTGSTAPDEQSCGDRPEAAAPRDVAPQAPLE